MHAPQSAGSSPVVSSTYLTSQDFREDLRSLGVALERHGAVVAAVCGARIVCEPDTTAGQLRLRHRLADFGGYALGRFSGSRGLRDRVTRRIESLVRGLA